jgi:hypothetical protein
MYAAIAVPGISQSGMKHDGAVPPKNSIAVDFRDLGDYLVASR